MLGIAIELAIITTIPKTISKKLTTLNPNIKTNPLINKMIPKAKINLSGKI